MRAPAADAPAGAPDPLGALGGLRVDLALVRGGTAVVAVAGEIDLRTAGTLRDRLVELHGRLPRTGPRRLVADFTAVPFCDAAGLGALVAAHNQIAADGGEIVLAGVRPAQLRLLRITGLHRVFAVHARVDDVWAAHGPSATSL
ncbi:STAS domain-containing protein [Actinomadura sp. GTD37]|uniref:STAS domain-containing protein n=1 Tax=Actinomadura sp. GTD37 TaxID=1778030 RepID=UPI0035C0DFD8